MAMPAGSHRAILDSELIDLAVREEKKRKKKKKEELSEDRQ